MPLFSRTFLGAVLAACVGLATAHSAFAAEVNAVDIRRPASLAGAERTYWIGAGAGAEEAVALREALVAAGARNVNLFVPDMVIVADVPPSAAKAVAGVSALSAFQSLSDRAVRATGATGASWGWIAESYALAERIARGEGAQALAAGDGEEGFRDVVVTIPPERVEEIQRVVESSRARDTNATRPAVARRINQNSEFLGGYILANFIYPESNGTRDASTENWSDEDLRQAKAGAAAAFISWQGKFPNMDIGFVIHHFEKIPTGYEPIAHDTNTDGRWIVDSMRAMGWGIFSDDPQPVVHEFNEAERATWRTQWVVTSFIASSRNTPGNRFKNGTAPYTAYAYLGGPFMVEPFPAGGDPNGIGETLVYSQIVSHEIGHLFYTLDEYPNSPGVCANRSGYLDISNGNQTMMHPGGGEARCTPLVNCIMHSAARFDQNRPWCDYSQGQLGVLDGNGNAIPDIFEAEPVITFFPEGPETVTTNTYTLRFKARATAVPNRNPYQAEPRASYTLPLDDGEMVFGAIRIGLDPVDGTWNEVEEDCEFSFSIPQAGQHVVLVAQVENNAGFKSRPATKTVFFAGVRFDRLVVLPKWNRIEVAWETTGETFGAVFDVFRLAPGESMPGTRIAQNVTPQGTSTQGQPYYRVHDFEVSAGTDYRYYVEGVFDLPYEGGMREYRSRSKVLAQTAMVQVVDIVSNLAPNPTRGSVTFSVAVPRSFNETPRGPARIPTDVDIRVYNVRGQLIRTLKRGRELNTVLTMRWDGTNQDGVQSPSGVYFLRVQSGDTEAVRKIVLLR